MEFSIFCLLDNSAACCSKNMANNIYEGERNELPEELHGIHQIHALQGLQFGDVGFENPALGLDDNNPERTTEALNAVLERQAKAIEKLASGIKDIAHALREIATALNPQNLNREEAEAAATPGVQERAEVSAFKKALPPALLKICRSLGTFLTDIHLASI